MEALVKTFSQAVVEAGERQQALCIRGGGSKDFYGGPASGKVLDVSAYKGIVAYEPTELVITARAGTPLSEVEAALREKHQMLAFEPPHFGSSATIGGCLAAGLSGPRRAYAGAARDFTLGVRLLDGMGKDLRFGGQVMKNVAGFDVSRLVVGSLGTLGIILEASLKVLPLPAVEITLRQQKPMSAALTDMNTWAQQPLPITATAWSSDELCIRLSGAAAAVEAGAKKIGGERLDVDQGTRFWHDLREQRPAFFDTRLPLWRLAVNPTTPALVSLGTQLLEWNGALRWLASDISPTALRSAAQNAGGHATLFRGGDKSGGVFQPLAAPLMTMHRNLKRAFDPKGIFNPQRMYPDF